MNYKDVASAAGVAPTVVSSNNSFLQEAQILTSPKYGFYIPTEGAIRFARESAWDEAGAKAHLRRIALECWFGQVVVQNFALRSNITREELKRALAIKCGATEGDAASLEFLVDFLIYTSLVVENENGTLSKGNFDQLEGGTKSQTQAKTAERPDREGVPLITAETRVSMVVHLHVNKLDELTPATAAAVKQWLKTLNAPSSLSEVHIEVSDLPPGNASAVP